MLSTTDGTSMLDSYNYRTTQNTSVNVQVEQANVHDAARLYGEVEEKVRKSFLGTLKAEGLAMSLYVSVFFDVSADSMYAVFGTVEVNGRRIYAKVPVKQFDNIQDVVLRLRDEVATQIANQLMGQIPNSVGVEVHRILEQHRK
ncbi:hypothetical protein [Achromobacter phage Motura]|uniref:Uncharacterized protein n=1 Tax=Achromobacter phage Motura TaxID=2591403 RepID=A0A514CSE1_9CAUD|nr:hypothetical protein H1O15_gp075 [Achromobacter phage Motura]QDH83388.1 hypothetical protein [Achromobacter phage Motura]